MLREVSNIFLWFQFLLAMAVGLVWVQSCAVGYEHIWSDPKEGTCGRWASTRGQWIYQSCDFNSTRKDDDPALRLPLRIPADFVVGTNPAGDRRVIRCGPYDIPFTFPSSRLFFGYHRHVDDKADPVAMTRWSNDWREYTVSYWFALTLLLLGPLVAFVRWWLKRGKSEQDLVNRAEGIL